MSVTDSGDDVQVATAGRFSSFHFFVLDGTNGSVIDWIDFDVDQPLPPQVSFESDSLRVSQLIDGGETQYVEWKRAVGQDAAIGEFFETVTAYANTNDGIILVGVEDNGEVTGLSPESPEGVKARILDLAETRCEPPPEHLEFEPVQFEGKSVMILTVRQGANPPYVLRRGGSTSKTEIYVRRGDKDRPARRVEIDQMYRSRQQPATPP